MAVDGDVALSTGTDERSAELDGLRIIDVVEVDAVVVANEEVIVAEGEIGVGGAVGRGRRSGRRGFAGGRRGRRRRCTDGVAGREAGGLGESRDFLQTEGGFSGVVETGFETNARVIGGGTRIRHGRGAVGDCGGLSRREHGERDGQ